MLQKVIASLCLWTVLTTGLRGENTRGFPDYTSENITTRLAQFRKEGNYEEAVKYFRDWKNSAGIPQNQEDSAAWYAATTAIAYGFLDLRQMDSAATELKPILDISAERYPKECLMVLNAWGITLIYKGNYADGRDHYRRIRRLLDAGELEASPLQYCNMVHNLGVAYKQLGDIDAALEVFHRIEDVIAEHHIDDNRLNALLHFNLAGSYMDIGEYERSLEHSRKSHAFHVAAYGTDHPSSAQTLNSVANGILMTGDKKGALQVYYDALAIFDRIDRKDHLIRAIVLLNIAETLNKLGQPEQALEYILPSVEIRKATYGIRHSEVARAYKAKGAILGDLGRFEEAVLCMDTALMALGYDPESENPYSGVSAMFNLFYTLDHKADLYYDRALNNPTIPNLMAARDAYAHGIGVMNDLRVHFKGKLTKGNLNEKSYGFYEPAIDICLLLYEKTGDTTALRQAMLWSAESKDNDFHDLIRGKEAMLSAGVPDSIREKHKELLEELARLESDWYESQNADAEQFAEARRNLDAGNLRYRQWISELEITYPKYYALLRDQPADDQTAEWGLKNRQIVEYFIGDEHAWAFVAVDGKTHAIRLADPKQIIQTATAWNADRIRNDNALSDLSKLIWQPVHPLLIPEKDLVIIPDGILHSIPFEILKCPNREYAVTSFTMSYESSSRSIATAAHAGRRTSWLGLAPAYADTPEPFAMASRGLDSAAMALRDEEWIRLPGAESEVRTIGSLIEGEYHIGREATERLFRQKSGRFDILHLSMHAWTDDEEPLLSGLIFSEEASDTVYDGRLYAHEIFQLTLPAKLIVLSACNTGVGTFRRGEGISSLAKAFRWAGADAAIMSLWKVPDESTCVIMQSFYNHLRRGEKKNEALRNAKLDYLDSVKEPELARPYYWAGFVLMGDTSPVYSRRAPTFLIALFGLGIFVTGVVLLVRRGSLSLRQERSPE